MTLDHFLNLYHSQKVDYDRKYGYQCVDLFRMYIERVLGLPQPEGVKSAKDFWHNYEKMPRLAKYFDKTTEGRTGDFAIWDARPNNPHGHIALIIGSLKGEPLVFHQDGYSQQGATFKQLYTPYLLGFLHPKEEYLD